MADTPKDPPKDAKAAISPELADEFEQDGEKIADRFLAGWRDTSYGKLWLAAWPVLRMLLISAGIIGMGIGALHLAPPIVQPPPPVNVNVEPPAPPKPPPPTPPTPPSPDSSDSLKALRAEMKDAFTSIGKRLDKSDERLAALEKPPPAPVDPDVPPMPQPQSMLPMSIDAIPGQPSFLVAKVSGKIRWLIPPGTPAFVKEYGTELGIVPKVGANDFYVGIVAGSVDLPCEWCLVKCGRGPQPPPDPPMPPNPPNPPMPPAPIPLPGFRVMMVYDPATLTTAQEGVVFGKKVRDYLQAKCVVGADNRTKEFRIYQTGIDTSAEVAWINNVMQRHPGQKSWMVVSDGKTGYDGPLPANADEALTILTKIGGQ